MMSIVVSPRKSDFFYVDYLALDPTSDGRHRYVPMKVLSVNKQGVTVQPGNIAHSTPVSPRKHAMFDVAIANTNYYRQKSLFLTFEQIRELVHEGHIYNARRPKTIFIDGWVVIPRSEMYIEP